jgi:hypothetical protein
MQERHTSTAGPLSVTTVATEIVKVRPPPRSLDWEEGAQGGGPSPCTGQLLCRLAVKSPAGPLLSFRLQRRAQVALAQVGQDDDDQIGKRCVGPEVSPGRRGCDCPEPNCLAAALRSFAPAPRPGAWPPPALSPGSSQPAYRR